MHDPGVDDCLAPREMHRKSWDSKIPALSARPNDGIHLLFYGHSWSDVAPIWPRVCNLSFPFPISLWLLPCPLLLSPILCPFCSCSYLSHSPTCYQWPLFPPSPSSSTSLFSTLLSLCLLFFVAHCTDVLFMVNSHKLLIWASLASCVSRGDEKMWGWRPTRYPCSQTSEQYVTQLPDDLDHSALQGSDCASPS